MTRNLSLLLAALALPVAALAATDASGTATNVKGTATDTLGEQVTQVKDGDTVTAGHLIETGPDSSLTITLPSGGKVVLAPNTKIRIRSYTQAEDPAFYSLEIILVRGRVTGDATRGAASSNFTVRTTAAVAAVAGTAFSVEFAPSGSEGGTIQVASTSGIPSVTSNNGVTSTAVQPNTSVSVTTSGTNAGTPQVSDLSTSQKSQIQNTLGGTPTIQGNTPANNNSTGGNTSGGNTTGSTPNVLLISPNGEGITTT